MKPGMKMLAIGYRDQTKRREREMRPEYEYERMEYDDVENRLGGGMRNAYDGIDYRRQRAAYDGGDYNTRSQYNDGRMNYGEMEGRFRDRRGREHYDNGRYAPMRNAYEVDDYSPDYRMEGDRMNTIGFFSPHEIGQEYRSNIEYNHGDEVGHRQGGKHERGYGSGGGKPFDKDTAKEWVHAIKNGMGPDWTIWTPEETKKFMEQARADCDPHEFYAVMNALHSDYYEVAKKYGVERPDFFADMTKAWLEDKDAVKDKAAAYYEYVVKH